MCAERVVELRYLNSLGKLGCAYQAFLQTMSQFFQSCLAGAMGQGPSKPGPPATQMQVLGLEMSSTVTASCSRALGILLQGPSFRGGAISEVEAKLLC